MDDRELLTIDNKIDDHMSDNQNPLNYCLHNSFTSEFKTCQLYEPSTQLSITVENKNLFLLHVNIRSVNKNVDNVNHDLLHLFQHLPDVICLSETKIKNLPTTNIILKGYHPIMHANSSYNSGGVGVFVADNYAVNIIGKDDLNFNCENIWMQIIDNITKNTFILGVVYRYPGGDVNSFITSFNEKLYCLTLRVDLGFILLEILTIMLTLTIYKIVLTIILICFLAMELICVSIYPHV